MSAHDNDPRLTRYADGVVRVAGGWPAGTWEVSPEGGVWLLRYAGDGDTDLFADNERYSPPPRFDTEDAAVDAAFARVAALQARHGRRQ